MDHGQQQRDHREYEEAIAAAALGNLEPEERELLWAHLVVCESCRASLGSWLSVVDALPTVVEEREPSPALRERLLAQATDSARFRSPRAQPAKADGRPSLGPVRLSTDHADADQGHRGGGRGFPAKWIAAVAAMLIIGLIGGVVADRTMLDEDDDDNTKGGRSVALNYPGDISAEDASLNYLPDQGLLYFQSHDLPAPPDGEVYQVWLIAEGSDPSPVGVVDQDTGEFATTLDTDRFDTFAITVEPSPLGSPGPTSDPVVVASLGDVARQ